MENEVKEPAPKYQYISPDEYLAMERASELKHEYYNGYVEAMCGASLKHNQIESNLQSEIGRLLKGKDCRILPANMRVSCPNRNIYVYPDATIICGKPLLEDQKFDTLLNPAVVFEILSPSTRSNDTGYKFLSYQQISSLREYIMIESQKRAVYIARKQKDKSWSSEEIPIENGHIHIQTVNLRISLDDIYYLTGL